MRAEIICIGTEILLGHIVNTNASWLSQKLAGLGIDLYYHVTVGDNRGRLIDAVRTAFKRSDIVLTTGGLGPTVDDITLEAIAAACGKKMVFNKEVYETIESFFIRRGIQAITCNVKRQAMLPAGSIWFRNAVGTAPGVIVQCGKKEVIALPGPPRELESVFGEWIIPYLRSKKNAGRDIIRTRTIKLTGIIESAVDDKVRDLLILSGKTTVGIYSSPGMVQLKITTKDSDEKKVSGNISLVENVIRRRLGRFIFGIDHETLEEVVGKSLLKKGKTISTAESCTGGLVAERITDISGSSEYFKMCVVAYANDIKRDVLGVSASALKKYGAVSPEVAYQMAKGVKRISGTDLSLGITGIAGPTGGTKDKPVGLVYISMCSGRKNITKEFRFLGTRKEIRSRASQAALEMLRRELI